MGFKASEGHLMTGWRFGLFFGGLIGLIGLAVYPVIIEPYLNQDKWKKIQQSARQGIKQDEVQPGNMKVWSDPFEKKN